MIGRMKCLLSGCWRLLGTIKEPTKGVDRGVGVGGRMLGVVFLILQTVGSVYSRGRSFGFWFLVLEMIARRGVPMGAGGEHQEPSFLYSTAGTTAPASFVSRLHMDNVKKSLSFVKHFDLR